MTMKRRQREEESALEGSNSAFENHSWYTEEVECSFRGYISTTQDALLVFESVRRGLRPEARRRLNETESKHLCSGQVYVFSERKSGIKRWTDGLLWSPSRVLSNFLVYRQVDQKALSSAREGSDLMQRATSSSSIINYPAKHSTASSELEQGSQIDSTNTLSSYSHYQPHLPEGISAMGLQHHLANNLMSDSRVKSGNLCTPSDNLLPSSWTTVAGTPNLASYSGSSSGTFMCKNTPDERSLVGSLRGTHLFSKRGLCKKTISVGCDETILHLVAYFTVADVQAENAFRFPLRIVRAPNGSSLVLDDDADRFSAGNGLLGSHARSSSFPTPAPPTHHRQALVDPQRAMGPEDMFRKANTHIHFSPKPPNPINGTNFASDTPSHHSAFDVRTGETASSRRRLAEAGSGAMAFDMPDIMADQGWRPSGLAADEAAGSDWSSAFLRQVSPSPAKSHHHGVGADASLSFPRQHTSGSMEGLESRLQTHLNRTGGALGSHTDNAGGRAFLCQMQEARHRGDAPETFGVEGASLRELHTIIANGSSHPHGFQHSQSDSLFLFEEAMSTSAIATGPAAMQPPPPSRTAQYLRGLERPFVLSSTAQQSQQHDHQHINQPDR